MPVAVTVSWSTLTSVGRAATATRRSAARSASNIGSVPVNDPSSAVRALPMSSSVAAIPYGRPSRAVETVRLAIAAFVAA